MQVVCFADKTKCPEQNEMFGTKCYEKMSRNVTFLKNEVLVMKECPKHFFLAISPKSIFSIKKSKQLLGFGWSRPICKKNGFGFWVEKKNQKKKSC